MPSGASARYHVCAKSALRNEGFFFSFSFHFAEKMESQIYAMAGHDFVCLVSTSSSRATAFVYNKYSTRYARDEECTVLYGTWCIASSFYQLDVDLPRDYVFCGSSKTFVTMGSGHYVTWADATLEAAPGMAAPGPGRLTLGQPPCGSDRCRSCWREQQAAPQQLRSL